MTRLSSICLLALAMCGIAAAAPPTEANWSEHMNQYAGKFHLHADGSDAPVYEFNFKWTEPGKIAEYTSRSVGDAPSSRSSGFCFWNAEEKRVEFNEIEFGKEEGRIAVDGFCVNASKDTMTWIVTFWTQEGVVRRIAMADTFTKNGISRAVTLLDGEPLPTEIVEWIRVK